MNKIPKSIIKTDEEFVFEFESEEDASELTEGLDFEYDNKHYEIARFYPAASVAKETSATRPVRSRVRVTSYTRRPGMAANWRS